MFEDGLFASFAHPKTAYNRHRAGVKRPEGEQSTCCRCRWRGDGGTDGRLAVDNRGNRQEAHPSHRVTRLKADLVDAWLAERVAGGETDVVTSGYDFVGRVAPLNVDRKRRGAANNIDWNV